MGVKRIWIVLLLACVAGCQYPGRSPQQPAARDSVVVPAPLPIPGSPKRLKPIRVYPRYPASKLTAKLARCRDILGSYSIPVAFTDVIELDAPQWEQIDESDRASLDDFCKGTCEYVVFFVDTITWKDVRVGGLGSTRWAVVAEQSYSNVVAHEAAHASGLPHRDVQGNVMCVSKCLGEAVAFDADQVAVLKTWGTAAAKSATAKVAEKVVACK